MSNIVSAKAVRTAKSSLATLDRPKYPQVRVSIAEWEILKSLCEKWSIESPRIANEQLIRLYATVFPFQPTTPDRFVRRVSPQTWEALVIAIGPENAALASQILQLSVSAPYAPTTINKHTEGLGGK